MPEMPGQDGKFTWILRAMRIVMIASVALLGLVVISCVAMAVMAIIDAIDTGQWMALAPPAIGVLAALAAVTWLFLIYGVIQVILSNEASVRDAAAWLGRIEELLENQAESIKELISLESLSDQAKKLICRRREIQTLRETVRDGLMRQEYDATERIIEDMESLLGYADEAAILREELLAVRKATLEEKIDDALGRLQAIMDTRDWPRALRVAHKMLSAFPGHPKVTSLPERVEVERTRHKRQLLQDYGEAVRKNDVDNSINLLKELDRHLTPQEAAALEESARGIFRAKLHNLGVQFAIHVTDQRWAEAMLTGEEIMRDFPNSRMAHEVSQKMPQLRVHAAEAANATR